MIFIGIDISKATFNAAILIDETLYNERFNNEKKGFASFLRWIKSISKDKATFCLEATGIYGLALAKFLHKKKQLVMVVNPIKTNAFCRMEMQRNKTDKADAQSIAHYANYLHLKGLVNKNKFTPKSKDFERLQYLNVRLDQLGKMKTQEQNRLDVSLDKGATKSIKSMIALIKKQQSQIEDEIKVVVKQNDELNQQVKLLISIDGIADKTAWAILAGLGDISFFENAKQVTSYAGLNPKIEDSGTSVHRTSLSKMGDKRLRKSLFMPALVAIRYNLLMIDLYERLLKQGKPKKVALCAVMRKLLVIAYGVLKSGKPFDPCYGK